MLSIFIVSDGTGATAERVVQAALAQFEDANVRVHRCPDVRTPEQVRAVVEEAADNEGVVIHTLVSNRLRHRMLDEARQRGVDSLDMLGPLMDRLATHLKLTPQEKPGLLKQLVEARTREIGAVEFAFHHDDGQNAEDLDRAEVVLVGASRTMKTPTMLYLAYQQWFAANVPLIPGIEPPPALLAVPPGRVFCLEMSADRLIELRRARAEEQNIPLEPYASLEAVRTEIQHARHTCDRHGWRIINVTGKSVEEVCREIIALLPKRPES